MNILQRQCFWAILLTLVGVCVSVKLEEQLYEDLLYSYNKVARPVKNSSDILTVKFGSALIRIIDVDEKKQILTTNLWLEMQWYDSKLTWIPSEYGNLLKLHVPSDLIWTPDIVLYNNAAGDPDITIYTDALVYWDGTVVWKPPAIYKSFCAIDVMWFPYDEQDCLMKFGTWTYTGSYVDLRQLPSTTPEAIKNKTIFDKSRNENTTVEFQDIGMDLSYFYTSAEWDLLQLTSQRSEIIYSSCCGPEKYVDISYNFSLRRKTLFYTCNLIMPCFLISFLTTFVFYLSDHKLTFAISILVTLIFFFLVLIDIIPPTSLVVPMFGRYLIFTMILVTMSIMISVVSVNFHFRNGATHRMPPWMHTVFLQYLPKLLCMQRPGSLNHSLSMSSRSSSQDSNLAPSAKRAPNVHAEVDQCTVTYVQGLRPPGRQSIRASVSGPVKVPQKDNPPPILGNDSPVVVRKEESDDERQGRLHRQVITRILQHVRFIADHFREIEEEEEISNDWTYVAMVMDRLFLIIFALLNMGTLFIILEAPTLYDTRQPLPIPSPTKPLGQDTLGPITHKISFFNT